MLLKQLGVLVTRLNMFKEARVKLTLYYLIIMTIINVFFSLIIYRGATAELRRIESVQQLRRPVPLNLVIEPALIDETKHRIALSLVYLNMIILGMAGVGGYFLAGKTLAPIKKNMDDQRDFISNASHELRTPLTSLKSEIEVSLRDKKLSHKDAILLIKSNLEEVNKMQQLSNYLLTLNKYQNGNENINFVDVDLKNVAMSAIGKRKVNEDLKSVMVKGNENSLIELARILIDNAFKYSGKNAKIEVVVKNKTLEVKDNGVGISQEDLPNIFKRFFRGDKSHTKDGYGLGLSIAKQIADIHGARLTVESKPGKGSSFKLHFS